LQKRSGTKDMYPNYWTASCSGHVSSGDTYENAAIRELQEELGIINKNLTFMTKTIITYPKETEYVSYYKITIPKDQKIIINNEEISEYKFVAIKELISTYNDMQLTPDFEYIISHYL
jgi:isopentenyldiphosphate isomerase